MNFLDLIIAIPLGYFIYKGWKRGLIFELATLVGVVCGGYAAIHCSSWAAQLLSLKGESAVLIAFFIVFVAVLLLAAVLGKAVEGFVKLVKVGKANNLLGSVFGMLKCLVVLSVLLNMLVLVDDQAHIISPNVKEHSLLFEPTYKAGNRLTAQLRQLAAQYRDTSSHDSKQ